MPSNFSKETSTISKSKSKKVMEYVHLLSTHQEDRVKKVDRKMHSNKNHTESKTNLNKDFCSNKYHLDKEKFSLNLNHQMKKHVRSKTQYFKPFTQTTCPDDIYQDELIASRYDMKKNFIKRQQSQKRIKSQSSKILQPNSHSRGNLHQSKTKLKPQVTKYASALTKPLKNNQKTTQKHNTKYQQPEKKYIMSINQNLHILREKLKKQKSAYSSKEKKMKKKLQDSKNMTFLNLSQILQRNDCDQGMIVRQNNRRNIKSDRSTKKTIKSENKQRLKEIFINLQQRVEYITSSLLEATKNKKDMKDYERTKQKLDGRSFSFMENPVINAKLRKSNFSTGQGSFGPDFQLKQLLKLKKTTQSQINKQISMDLKSIKEIYRSIRDQSRPKTARVIESGINSKEKSALRTYQKHQEDETNFRQSNWSQKQSLLNLLNKYHQMTVEILPRLSETILTNSIDENPQIGQVRKVEGESQEAREQNRKFIGKYNEIMDKNFKYQQVINALIRDGVDVEKYMQGFINKMT